MSSKYVELLTVFFIVNDLTLKPYRLIFGRHKPCQACVIGARGGGLPGRALTCCLVAAQQMLLQNRCVHSHGPAPGWSSFLQNAFNVPFGNKAAAVSVLG